MHRLVYVAPTFLGAEFLMQYWNNNTPKTLKIHVNVAFTSLRCTVVLSVLPVPAVATVGHVRCDRGNKDIFPLEICETFACCVLYGLCCT